MEKWEAGHIAGIYCWGEYLNHARAFSVLLVLTAICTAVDLWGERPRSASSFSVCSYQPGNIVLEKIRERRELMAFYC